MLKLLFIALSFIVSLSRCGFLDECCVLGERWFVDTNTCVGEINISGGDTCEQAARVCCLNKMSKLQCDAGRRMALRGSTSSCPLEDECPSSKYECCHCCLLAKKLQKTGRSCSPKETMSPLCRESFLKCCNKSDAELGTFCSQGLCQHLCNSDGSCKCREGYELAFDGTSCRDIDECQTMVDDCLPTQRCENTEGSYRCVRSLSCGTGYYLDPETSRCVDVDECQLPVESGRRPKCRRNEFCFNTEGSYRCKPRHDCSRGFRRDSRTGECKDINECEERSHTCTHSQTCRNSIGSYRCVVRDQQECDEGMRRDPVFGCTDINECEEGLHQCPTQSSCLNLVGASRYKCDCPRGYRFNSSTRTCEDIDECHSPGNVCSFDATCQNTRGAFRCICKTGFEATPDNRCKDVNECQRTPSVCEHGCINVEGSYQCVCNRGYTLAPDRHTCSDIDECSLWSGDRLCFGGCKNTQGSYKCICPSGYRLEANNKTCKDINECEEFGYCGSRNQICVNTFGGFKCHPVRCPHNYVLDSNNTRRCNRRWVLCTPGDSRCRRLPEYIEYEYLHLPSMPRLPVNRRALLLFTMKGPATRATNVHFGLELESVWGRGRPHATRDSFILQQGDAPNSVTVSLREALNGPQDIRLKLTLKIHHAGIFSGKIEARLFVHIGKHEKDKYNE